MVRGKETVKGLSLILAVGIMIISTLPISVADVGLFAGCPLSNRLTYPFFHTSFIHAAINSWCLLTIVFLYETPLLTFIAAYIISASFPVGALSFLYNSQCPTIGLSGMCYVLLGSISLSVGNAKQYWFMIASVIGIGFLFPEAVNSWLHTYCYLSGVLIAILNKPV